MGGSAQNARVLIDISSATLRKLVKLSERKEALLSQIQELDRQMAALQQPLEERFIRVPPVKRVTTTKSAKVRRTAKKNAPVKEKVLSS